jgi:hypothetical protein
MMQKLGVSPDDRETNTKSPLTPLTDFNDIPNPPESSHQESEESEVEDVADRFGKLIVSENSSRFVSPGIWSHLHAEIEDIKDILEPSSDLEDDRLPEQPWDSSSNHGFFFNLSSSNVNMSALHPPSYQVMDYWQVYKDNFDPIFKVLHAPTYELDVHKHAANLSQLSRQDECMMFAIYFGAISTLPPEECETKFGPRQDLLRRYRFGVQQAFARAKFLKTDSVSVLQALLIFVISLRNEEDVDMLGAIGSLAIRIAQRLGLHRDGSHYPNLSIFQQEIRRRLWWHTVSADSRFFQDLSFDPRIYDMMADTRLPLNLNDSDLSKDMKTLPASRIGCTDMTFNLIMFQNGMLIRKLHFVSTSESLTEAKRLQNLQERRRMVEEAKRNIETCYFQNFDDSIPIYWLASRVARRVLSKMWLTQCVDAKMNMSQETRDQLFKVGIANLEFLAFAFQKSPAARFSWIRPVRGLWHDTAFLLSELCVRRTGPDVERAWTIVRQVIAMQLSSPPVLESHLWKPLQRLMARAEEERMKADIENPQVADYSFLHEHSAMPPMNQPVTDFSPSQQDENNQFFLNTEWKLPTSTDPLPPQLSASSGLAEDPYFPEQPFVFNQQAFAASNDQYLTSSHNLGLFPPNPLFSTANVQTSPLSSGFTPIWPDPNTAVPTDFQWLSKDFENGTIPLNFFPPNQTEI